MKLRFIAALLTLTLLLMTFSGCTLLAAEAQLDAAEEALEQRAERVEEQVESAVKDTVIRNTESTNSELSPEEAKQIALTHAGVSAETAERLYAEYEIDDRVPQYDVSFRAGGAEYVYEIHAVTGEIL